MYKQTQILQFIIVSLAILLQSGCGQKGPLTLPKAQVAQVANGLL